MPIRFTCPSCSQQLSVTSRKAGHRVTCPKCEKVTRVPRPESPAVGAAASPQEPRSDPGEPPSGVGGGSELIYESADIRSSEPGDHRVSVPRRILYIQGFLLGAVALTFFIFGLIVGSRSAVESNGTPRGPSCVIFGTVRFQRNGDEAVADEGTVAMLLPSASRPDQKLAPIGLRPDDPVPDHDHPGLAAISQWGGSFSRADRHGKYRLQAPATGRYFLLLVSANTMRSDEQQPQARDLAELGRYFLPATELLGKHGYRWRELRVSENRQIDVSF